MTGDFFRKQLEECVIKLKTPEGYLMAGLPRFPRLYGRDGLISAWQLLEYDPSIARETLEILANHQGKQLHRWKDEERGKIPHEVPRNEKDRLNLLFRWGFLRHFPYYGSVDATPLWIIVLYKYWQKTQDTAFVHEMIHHVHEAVYWMRTAGDKDHDMFIQYKRRNKIAGLKHQGWKDGIFESYYFKLRLPLELVEVQGYAYAAFKAAAQLMRLTKHTEGEVTFYNELADRLQTRFFQKFWIPKNRYFAYALEHTKFPQPDIFMSEKRPVRTVTSNAGHLLFTGILNHEKAKAVTDRIFHEDMRTNYGIRTLASSARAFSPSGYHRGTIWPHDNWIIHEGLMEWGFFEEARALRSMIFGGYEVLKKPYECYGVDLRNRIFTIRKASMPQAWAVGAYLNLILREEAGEFK